MGATPTRTVKKKEHTIKIWMIWGHPHFWKPPYFKDTCLTKELFNQPQPPRTSLQAPAWKVRMSSS